MSYNARATMVGQDVEARRVAAVDRALELAKKRGHVDGRKTAATLETTAATKEGGEAN